MAPYVLKPLTFDGTNLWADPFRYACFQREDHLISGPIFDPVTADVVASWPKLVRIQPGGRNLPLHIFLNDVDQEGVEAIHKLFDPDKGECLLLVSDSQGRTLRLSAQVVQIILEEEEHQYMFTINLYVPKPIWESDEEHSDPSATGESTFPITWDIVSAGTIKAPPTIEITPSASKDHVKGYKRRWFINIANRVPRRLQSTNGLPYPIALVDGDLDLQAEIDASRLLSSLDDLRVFIDGKFMSEHRGADRWIAGGEDDESETKSPTAAAGTNWTTPTNVYASDDARANYDATTQDLLKITGFNCAVPDDATILGITVYVEGVGVSSIAQNRTIDVGLTKDGAALAGAYKQQVLGQTESVFTLGGAADLWSTTLTPTEANAATFGVLTRDTDTTAAAVGIDHVQVKVTYAVPYKLWCNCVWEAGRSATIDGALSAGRSDGDDIEVDNPSGTAGWPESGFGLFEEDGYEETFYYTAKTATKLLNCTWGCCGTSKVAHADGTTIWVQEHVIMLESDYTGAGDPPAPDDTKPVIDLDESTNSKHVYRGPWVVPTTNRSGGWRAEYREENALSPYIALRADAEATMKFSDRQPAGAETRHTGVELYVPCGVLDDTDALEHGVYFSGSGQNLIARLYGRNIETGYEALLASYYEPDEGAKVVTPTDELVRLRWNVAHATIVGWMKNQTTYSAIDTDDIWVAEFVLDQVAKIYGWAIYCEKSSSPDGTLKVGIRAVGAITEDWPLLTPESTVANADIPATYAWVARTFTTPYILQAGTYGLSVRRSSATTGTVHWGMTTGRQFARGDRWVEQSGGSPWNWINGPDSSLLFAVLTDGTLTQDDEPFGTESYIEFANFGIDLDTPPYVHIPAQQEIYSWDLLLENLTTEQSAIISFISALDKKLTINCETGAVTTEDLPIGVPWAVVWEDEVNRLHLASGTNNMRISDRSGETSGVGTLTVVTKHRDRWS